MSVLPFLQAPAAPSTRRCGTPATGILEFPVYGGLTVGESHIISSLLASEQSAFVEGARTADAISKAESISLSEAFSLLESSIRGIALEPEADAIRIRHAEKIERLARMYAAAGQRNMTITVTALIRCRLNLPEWTTEQTEQLPLALFNDIWQLAEDEQVEEGQGSESPPDEETLGKPRAASGRGRKRTG